MASINDTRIGRILEVIPDLLKSAPSLNDLLSEVISPELKDLIQATGENPTTFIEDYRRIMDIYFAIKIGGVAKHIKRQKTLQPAVQAYFDKFRARITEAGEEGPMAELVGFVDDLAPSGISDHVESFTPDEEQAVRDRLSDIEAFLA